VGISIGTCHQIFTETLEMHRISAKFVPRFLTDDHKITVLKSVSNCLPMQMVMKTFLKNNITGDETWVCGCDVETKMQCSQWMGKGSPQPKKHR
jgi:hypothetical protein